MLTKGEHFMSNFFDEISDDEYWSYEHFSNIDQNGLALDEFGNEFRDQQGQLVLVPKADWHLFKQVEVDYV